MCDTAAFAASPANVSLKVMLPSGKIFAANVPVAVEEMGGTSFAPRSLADRLIVSSSALTDPIPMTLAASPAKPTNQNLFIICSFHDLTDVFGDASYDGGFARSRRIGGI